MAQRTEIFDLGRLSLTSGEGRRLDLEVPVGGLPVRRPALRRQRRGCGRRARRGPHHQRVLAAAALRGRARRPVHALPRAGGRTASRSTPARSTSRAAARSFARPYLDGDELDLRGLGPRRAGARASDPDRLPRGVPRPVPGLRREPQHGGPRARARAASPTRAGPSSRELKLGRELPLALARLMAVPKQRQSHSRTNKRRSQHKIAAPHLRHCPHCHAPRLPHRVCPECGTYAGREVVVQRPDTGDDVARSPVIAVDANGADRGRPQSPRARAAPATDVLLFGPAAELGERGDGVEVVDAPVDDRRPRGAGARGALEAGRLDRPGRARGGRRPRRRARLGRQHRPDARRRDAARASACAGVHRPALAVLLPIPGGPVLLLDAGANVEVRPEHLVQFAYMGAAFMEAVLGVERPRVGPAVGRRGAGQGHARRARGRARPARGGRRAQLRRATSRASTCPARDADVVVTDGFTGNVALKVLEGTSRLVRDAIRDADRARAPSRAVGGLLIRGRVGRLRERARPRGRRRRDPARAAQAGGRGPRQLRPARHRQRGRARAARGGRGHGRAHRGRARGRRRIAVRARW